MRYLKYITLCALLLIWGLPAQAVQLKGLYEAEVELTDQALSTRATAMGEAMAAVLLKVSGSAAVLSEPVIKSAMKNASRYVQQFRYRNEAIPAEKREKPKGGEPAAEERLLLWVGFDSASIDNLLRRFGFNVWSAARPGTLVWLAVEEGSRRVLVGANDRGLVRDVLESEAQRRAIPLRLPLLDLTDQSKVRAVDVWGGFVDNIEAASLRYETQAVLIGKLYQLGKEWEARWTLRYQGDQYEWQQRTKNVSTVIASGVGGTSDYLSQRFAASSYLGLDQLALRIEGVATMQDFRRINDYLLSLHGVSAVTLRKTEASASSFLVEIEGGRETVLQAIAMGDMLAEVEPPPEVLQPEAPLELQPEPVEVAPSPVEPAEPVEPIEPTVEPSSAEPVTPAVADDAAPTLESDTLTDDAEELPPQPQVIPLQELVYRLLS